MTLHGEIGGVQFSGRLESPLHGNDILLVGDNVTLLYNLSGVLSTQSLIFTNEPAQLIVASRNGDMVDVEIVRDYRLLKAYPNPFNPSTNINYKVNAPGNVEIVIYNLRGQEVLTLVNQNLQPGTHSIVWNGIDSHDASVPSGTYLVRMKQSIGLTTQRITLLK